MPQTRESEIGVGVLRVAASRANGVATFKRCRAEIPGIVTLTDGDRAMSQKRPGEMMWHQIVRNIKSHSGVDGNFIDRGLLEHLPRVGYKITNAGRAYLKKLGY